MMISVPYGKSFLSSQIPEDRLRGILLPTEPDHRIFISETEIVKGSLLDPVVSPGLKELSVNKEKIVIISSDHTRPVPSRIIMPLLLEEIRSGNPYADITILIATGGHRETTREEIIEKYGPDIASGEKIVVHNSHAEDEMIDAGILPSGGRMLLNKLAMEADLLVAEGFIEPHFFAGFSGGRKSILPGVAGYGSIMANHCAEFISHNRCRTGILEGNPIHEDMLFAARTAGLAFICNVVIDESKKIIAAFSGEMNEAHLAGCDYLRKRSCVKAIPSDIVIAGNGGYPMDQNVYQAVKGMTAAEASVKDGGVIILAAECSDGFGGKAFANTFCDQKDPADVLSRILSRGRDETEPDQWQIQIFLRVLLKATVIMVTSLPEELIEFLNMKWAASIEDALHIAEEILGDPKASIAVIPDGVGVIVE